MKTRQMYFTTVLLGLWVLLGACTSQPAQPKIARIEVSPAALLLSKVGESQVLSAKVFDEQGKSLETTLTWTSSNGGVVSVDTKGKVAAVSGLGSAQITVQAGNVKASVPVLVAQPVAGAVLVPDSQIISDPKPLEGAPLGTQLTVTLAGTTPPAPGTILIGREDKPLGGKVISAVVSGGQTVVTLEWVPLNQLFTQINYKEALKLAEAQMDFSPETEEFFDITPKEDGSFSLKLKPGKQISASSAGAGVSAQNVEGTRALGPFKCEVKASAFQVSLVDVQISLTPNLSADMGLDPFQFVIKGSPKLDLSLKPMLSGALNGKLTCKLEVGQFKVAAPGPLGLILSGFVPYGPGFEIEAKVPVGGVGLEIKKSFSADFKVGFDCTGGTCVDVSSFENQSQPIEVKPVLPQVAPKLELSAFAFAFFDANLTVLKFAALKVQAGLKLESKLASEETQANDPEYKSQYGLKLEVKLGVGDDIDAVLEIFKTKIKPALVFKKPELKLNTPLAASPTASISADKSSFKTAEVVKFKVKLDPNTLNVPAIGYNIESVRVYRKVSRPDGSLGLILATEGAATSGQTEIEMSWSATLDGTVPGNFVAFVQTRLLPAMRLELGEPVVTNSISISPTSVTLTALQTQQFTATVVGPSDTSVAWTSTGGAITNTGRFTAPSTPGTYQVTATSVADPSLKVSATVTVTASSPGLAGTYRGTLTDLTNGITSQVSRVVRAEGNRLIIQNKLVADLEPNGNLNFLGYYDGKGGFGFKPLGIDSATGTLIDGHLQYRHIAPCSNGVRCDDDQYDLRKIN